MELFDEVAAATKNNYITPPKHQTTTLPRTPAKPRITNSRSITIEPTTDKDMQETAMHSNEQETAMHSNGINNTL